MAGRFGASHGGVESASTALLSRRDAAASFLLLAGRFQDCATSGPVRSPDMTVHVTSPDGSLERRGLAGLRCRSSDEAARLESARQR
jgi:hypothetical protein